MVEEDRLAKHFYLALRWRKKTDRQSIFTWRCDGGRRQIGKAFLLGVAMAEEDRLAKHFYLAVAMAEEEKYSNAIAEER